MPKARAGGVEIRGFASKAAEHVLRLAGVLTLVENLDAPEIGLQEMTKAAELVDFYLTEAVRLAGAAAVSEELETARRVLEFAQKWTAENNTGGLIHLAAIYQGGRLKGGSSAENARKVAGTLCEHGWFVPVKDPPPIHGKNYRHVWLVKSPQ